MYYAHYFKSGKQHTVVISDSPRPVGTTYTVENKRAARQLAAELCAKRWNY